MPLAETIPERIEFYEYSGQPRDDWPEWMRKVFHAPPINRKGDIATAHFAWGEDRPEWYRWYAPEKFWEQYRTVSQ